jgi:cell division protein ZapA
MSEATVSVDVYILDKSYRIACPEDEREDLVASARLLNDQMRDIRGSSRVLNNDRLAVMAALNIAHELLLLRRQTTGQDLDRRMSALADRIASALNIGDETAV